MMYLVLRYLYTEFRNIVDDTAEIGQMELD